MKKKLCEEIFKRLIKSGSVRFISQKQSDNPRPIVIELVRLYTDDGSEWYCYATLDVETAKVFEFGVKKHLADIEGIVIALQYSQSSPSQILREEEPEYIRDVEILSRGGVSLFRPFKHSKENVHSMVIAKICLHFTRLLRIMSIISTTRGQAGTKVK